MPKAAVIANERAAHQISWGGAFAEGMQRHGWTVEVFGRKEHPSGVDLVALWGVRNQQLIQSAKSAGAEIVILERGYIGDRMQWTSVSKGGDLNGRARFGLRQDAGARFASISRLKPWNDGDGVALIMGQVPGDMSVSGVNLKTAYESAADQCRALGYEAHYRPHPMGAAPVDGVQYRPSDEPLEAALDAAAFVVTVNSNSGVDAALAGVPVVALDRGSMAWEVASHQVGEISKPSRLEWAAHLAWKQWNRDEIANGDAWAALEAA